MNSCIFRIKKWRKKQITQFNEEYCFWRPSIMFLQMFR